MPPSIHPSIHPTKPFKNPHYHIYSSKNHGITEYIAHMYHYNKQIPRKNIENHKFGQKGVLGLPSDLQIQLIKTKERRGGDGGVYLSRWFPKKSREKHLQIEWIWDGEVRGQREREGEELHSGLGLALGENEWGRRKGVGPARVKGAAHPRRVHQPC